MTKRLKAPPSGSRGGAPSISDAFADMLLANEDMIAATAECQTERDVKGVLAYQRILHRNLMEMAEFIDSMFGVYSNANASSSSTAEEEQKESEEEPRVDVDLTAEPVEKERPIIAKKGEEAPAQPMKKSASGSIFTVLEAGEKVREIQRSKEKWIKSRHQVLEEEEASAVLEDSPKVLSEVSESTAEPDPERGQGGLALVNQLRVHQQITAFINLSKEAATAVAPAPPLGLTLPNQIAVAATAPSLPLPLSVPPVPLPTQAPQQSAFNDPPMVAMPPAQAMLSMLPMLAPAPPLLLNPQPQFLPMQWPAHVALQAATATRTMMPVRAYANTTKTEFKRMCEECRKRHFSVRRCRLVLQHTDPEWQPAQTSSPTRRRRRKQNVAKT